MTLLWDKQSLMLAGLGRLSRGIPEEVRKARSAFHPLYREPGECSPSDLPPEDPFLWSECKGFPSLAPPLRVLL